jgi:hypothetical protein
MPESMPPYHGASVAASSRVNLLLQMQAPMLVATKKFAIGEHAFAFRQMHTAMNATHHILAFNGRRLFMRFFLPLF